MIYKKGTVLYSSNHNEAEAIAGAREYIKEKGLDQDSVRIVRCGDGQIDVKLKEDTEWSISANQ